MPVVSTLPHVVEPEITTPLVWEVGWRVPFTLLSRYDGLLIVCVALRGIANFTGTGKHGVDRVGMHQIWVPCRNSSPHYR